MSRKSNNISILQFGEHLISRLRVRRSAKGLDVLGYDFERGDWSSRDGSLDDALKEFVAKHHVTEDQTYSVIPRHEMTARILELPSQDLSEIAGMIRLSAEEYVPFPVEELSIDQCILQKLPDGRSRVLAVFAHEDVVNAHVKTLQYAEVQPEQIFLSTACLTSAFAAAKGTRGCCALVNLASEGLEVVVIREGRFEYGRAVASNLSPEDAEEELRVEIRASLSAYRRESEEGEPVEQIYLCSDWTDVAPYCRELMHDFEQPLEPADFAHDVVKPGSADIPMLTLASLGAALLAQDRAAVSIRLLPERLVAARQRLDVKRKAVQLAAVAAVALAGLGALYGQAVYQRRAYLDELQARISKIEPSAQNIASKQKQLRILQNQVGRSGSIIELMAALVDLIPPAGMNINRLVYSRPERLEIFGRAENLSQIEDLAQSLIDVGEATLPQFAHAKQVYERNEAEEFGHRVWDFSIEVPFPQEEDQPEEEQEKN